MLNAFTSNVRKNRIIRKPKLNIEALDYLAK
jgi:hypothetical protein